LERLDIEKDKRVKPENHLRVFQKPSQKRTNLKELFDYEYQIIKQHRPDIIASWKYYMEFEKMCEELDTTNKAE